MEVKSAFVVRVMEILVVLHWTVDTRTATLHLNRDNGSGSFTVLMAMVYIIVRHTGHEYQAIFVIRSMKEIS